MNIEQKARLLLEIFPKHANMNWNFNSICDAILLKCSNAEGISEEESENPRNAKAFFAKLVYADMRIESNACKWCGRSLVNIIWGITN